MRRATFFSIAAIFLAWPGLACADDDDSGPRGTYFAVGSQACLYGNEGFDVSNQPNDGNIYSNSGNSHAITIYNGDGTGTTSGTFISITVPPTPNFRPSASNGTFQFSFTHSSVSNNSFTSALVPGSYMGTISSGPRAGQTFTVDRVDRTHLITNNGKTITAADVIAAVENITYSGAPFGPFQRICWHESVGNRR